MPATKPRVFTPAAVLTGLVALPLAAAMARQPDALNAWLLPATVGTVGVLSAALAALRLRAILGGAASGYAVAVASAWPFFVHESTGAFLAVALTFVFFMSLGAVIGSFVEFVLFLHHVTHGYAPKDYPYGPDES